MEKCALETQVGRDMSSEVLRVISELRPHLTGAVPSLQAFNVPYSSRPKLALPETFLCSKRTKLVP